MTGPDQRPTNVHLHGGPSDGDAAIVYRDSACIVGHDVRVVDPGGNGVLVYGPVRRDDQGIPHADYVPGEHTGSYRAVPPLA